MKITWHMYGRDTFEHWMKRLPNVSTFVWHGVPDPTLAEQPTPKPRWPMFADYMIDIKRIQQEVQRRAKTRK